MIYNAYTKDVLTKDFNTVEDIAKSIAWSKQDIVITDSKGETVFKQEGVEAPRSWSYQAVSIAAEKYFQPIKGVKENSVHDMMFRIARTIANKGYSLKYFTTTNMKRMFEKELYYILINQMAAFNSPVFFNCGVTEKGWLSACFILGINDSMEDILETLKIEGLIFKYGSGVGKNLSSLRSSKERLSNGGIPSGPISFMKMYDTAAATIKSGGKHRRSAKMEGLNINHPDILEFIRCKPNEEKKAQALINAGMSTKIGDPNNAYQSVAFQNSNLFVGLDDEFLNNVINNKKHHTKSVTTGETVDTFEANQLLDEIVEALYTCGDPGIHFTDTINRWHTCKQSGRINSSNPCTEFLFIDNSACNLSSINLIKFLENKTFNIQNFIQVVQILITAMDIICEFSNYPTKSITENSHKFRPLGLGYTNLGSLLMSCGVPYDSDEARTIASAITGLMTSEAYRTSWELGTIKEPFAGYSNNKESMSDVLRMHNEAILKLSGRKKSKLTNLSDMIDTANDNMDYIYSKLYTKNSSNNRGFRNAQVTLLAPTGTISFIMDATTTGIEPDTGLVKVKSLVGVVHYQ